MTIKPKKIDWITMQEMNETEIKSKSKSKPKPKFKCRICGNTEYRAIYNIPNRLGETYYPIAYQCCGCSVVFKDIIKFSIEDNAEIKSD